MQYVPLLLVLLHFRLYILTVSIFLSIYLFRCLSIWMIQSTKTLSRNSNRSVSLSKCATPNRNVSKHSVTRYPTPTTQQRQQQSLLKRGPVWGTRPTHHPQHDPDHLQPLQRVIRRIAKTHQRPTRRALTIFFQPTTRRIFL